MASNTKPPALVTWTALKVALLDRERVSRNSGAAFPAQETGTPEHSDGDRPA